MTERQVARQTDKDSEKSRTRWNFDKNRDIHPSRQTEKEGTKEERWEGERDKEGTKEERWEGERDKEGLFEKAV